MSLSKNAPVKKYLYVNILPRIYLKYFCLAVFKNPILPQIKVHASLPYYNCLRLNSFVCGVKQEQITHYCFRKYSYFFTNNTYVTYNGCFILDATTHNVMSTTSASSSNSLSVNVNPSFSQSAIIISYSSSLLASSTVPPFISS